LSIAVLVFLVACVSGGSGGGAEPNTSSQPLGTGSQVTEQIVGDSSLTTAVFDGQDQSATAGTSVPIAPAMVVRDGDGRLIENMPVTFMVITGEGAVTGASTRTDAAGVARVGGWTLGPLPGVQQLVARTPGLPEVTFYATASPVAGAGTISVEAAANNQFTTVGTALAVDPVVTVRDASGALQAGIDVTFSVLGAGGAVQFPLARTDAAGRASAGRWTLGVSPGTQRIAAAAAGYGGATITATALATGTPSLARTVFMSGLQNPWDLAFTPDGAMLYTERGAGLSVRLANGTRRQVYAPADMVAFEQCGMLGVAIDPQFATNRRIYLYLSSNASGATDSRIVAVTVDAGYTSVSGRRDILTGITYLNGTHCGGRVRFGPDGYLYVTTGDTRQGVVPQSVTALGAKVLRIDRDGNAAPGNNVPAGGHPSIFARGFRNVQGIDFRPGSGTPYISEHGPGYSDEVTPIRAGGNGGWDPFCSAGSEHGVQYCGYNGTTPMTDTVRYPDAMRPAWTTGNLSEGMAGGAFVAGAAWREWHGAFVAALLAGRRLEVLRLDGSGTFATSTPILDTLGVRLRTVVLGPDGALYITTDGKPGGDEVWRLAPG